MTPTTPPAPITHAEAATLFADLSRFPLIALAVSGGPDSLALLHLVAHWRTTLTTPPAILVLTVDHGLRPQSAAEAQTVAGHASSLGLPHETLIWSGPKPTTGLPNAARDARYRLLTERLAREPASPIALFTAHTQDDQAETLLMRLARGSGLDGLASMSRERRLNTDLAITLIRPLLNMPKARLEATLAALVHPWITDPTNADLTFERPRLRQAQPARNAAGLTNAALALSASRLARANAALNAATQTLSAAAVTQTPAIAASIDRAAFTAASDELRIRLLATLLYGYGGIHPPARLSEIERLDTHLTAARATPTTLGGCLITPMPDAITIHREPGRGLPVTIINPGQTLTWDARFALTLAPNAPRPCTVRALTSPEWQALRTDLPTMPINAALTLPTLWQGEHLVAAPDFGALRTQLEQPLHPTRVSRPSFLAGDATLRSFEPLCSTRALPPKSVQ